MAGPQLERCVEGGALVGAKGWLPRDAFDRHWGDFHPIVGCSRLVCPRCDQFVRQLAGFEVREGERLTPQELVGLDDWRSCAKLEPSATGRVYACRCQITVAFRSKTLHPEVVDPLRDEPTAWTCSGHPPLVLPCTLDGVRLDDEVDTDDLVADAFAGRAPSSLPWAGTEVEKWRDYWIRRLYVLLQDPEQRTAIGHSVALRLTSGEDGAVAAALLFFLHHPLAPGIETFLAWLRTTAADLSTRPDPAAPRTSLYDRAIEALGRRAGFQAPQGGPLDPDAVALACTELTSGRPTESLVFSVARVAPEAVADIAAAFAQAHRDDLGGLVLALRDAPAPLRQRAFQAIATAVPAAGPSLRTAISQYLYEPARSQMLQDLGPA